MGVCAAKPEDPEVAASREAAAAEAATREAMPPLALTVQRLGINEQVSTCRSPTVPHVRTHHTGRPTSP